MLKGLILKEKHMNSGERINWYHCPVDKKKFAELAQKKNLLPLAHVMAQLLLSVVTGFLVYLSWKHLAWPFWLIAIYIHCALYEFLTPTAAIHELSHRTVFKLNQLCQIPHQSFEHAPPLYCPQRQ